MAGTTMIHIRVDEQVKAQAAETLAAMGLSISDAVRMLLVRVAAEKALPFEGRVPNADTRAAMQELEAGQGQRFDSIEALMADLHAADSGMANDEIGFLWQMLPSQFPLPVGEG